jgi:hypothetical protein
MGIFSRFSLSISDGVTWTPSEESTGNWSDVPSETETWVPVNSATDTWQEVA